MYLNLKRQLRTYNAISSANEEQGTPLANVLPHKKWNGPKTKAALQKTLEK